jgi:hypothetical protein
VQWAIQMIFSARVTLYLEDNRRKISEWIQKIQHLCAGLPIFLTGVKHLQEGSERSLGAFEIALAGCVLFTFIKEFRALRRTADDHDAHQKFSIGWFDLAAGILLMFEAFHGHHLKPGYLRPQFFMGLITLTIAILHGHLHRYYRSRRFLTVDESGLEFRFGPFRYLVVKWNEISRVEFQEDSAILHRTDGKENVLKLKRFANREAARQLIIDHPSAASLFKLRVIK